METYHVYPINDLESHNLEEKQCECSPTVKFIDEEDLSYVLVVHNAYDLREVREELFGAKLKLIPQQ